PVLAVTSESSMCHLFDTIEDNFYYRSMPIMRRKRQVVRSKSTMPARTKNPARLNLRRLGDRVRDERERRGLSLDALSERAHVSRSMLSAIERGTKAPTVLVLDRVATGLDTSLARLLGDESRSRLILLRRRD